MENILFILNPVAGGGKAKELEGIIKTKMKSYRDINYRFIKTTKPGEATNIVLKSSEKYIISVGGDGTINEIAKGIIERGYGTLGILPGGTGNDLSRSLGIPLDTEEAIDFIFMKSKVKKLNVCIANDRYFLNIASLGFDAEVVNNASNIKHRIKSKLAYFLSVLYTLIIYKNKNVKVTIDGKESKENLVLLAAGNGSYYGGGFEIMPQSKLDDGKLHVCFVKDASKITLITLFPSIFTGSHLKHQKYVKVFTADEVIIEADQDMFYNLDGEILNAGKSLRFTILNKKIEVLY